MQLKVSNLLVNSAAVMIAGLDTVVALVVVVLIVDSTILLVVAASVQLT